MPYSVGGFGPLRLLLAADDAEQVASFTSAHSRKYEIVTAPSARAALARLEADAAFDGILCDLVMPQCTGAQLRDRLQVSSPALARRFIWMSNTGTFQAAEADPLLLGKPIESDALARALRSLSTPLLPSFPERWLRA
jgi:CheY-like chemotaxis protein